MAEENKPEPKKDAPPSRTERPRTAKPERRRMRTSRRGRGRKERGRSEFEQKVIDMRRVARVVAGGRRFSFSVAVVIGDRKGSVGVGIGKGQDTALAIEKAARNARKNLMKVPLTEARSIAHEVQAKYCGSLVFLAPAPGRGLVAGSSARTVLDLAGMTDVTAKVLSRSKNKLNNAQAAVTALRAISGKK